MTLHSVDDRPVKKHEVASNYIQLILGVQHLNLQIPCYKLVKRFNKYRSFVFRKPKLRVVGEAD